MLTFPYIDIINSAPTPLVVIFGMGHVAMGWAIYTIAKDMYIYLSYLAVLKEAKYRQRRLPERALIFNFFEIVELMTDARIKEDFKDTNASPPVPSKTKERIKWLARTSWSAYIVKLLIFCLSWAVIYFIKKGYMN